MAAAMIISASSSAKTHPAVRSRVTMADAEWSSEGIDM
ncbi:hypothetical protein BN2537_4771 [Streptomyces venezuelae]|nr:hypothetical protein BN2537_4771 [Streptomyces venezuelae]